MIGWPGKVGGVINKQQSDGKLTRLPRDINVLTAKSSLRHATKATSNSSFIFLQCLQARSSMYVCVGLAGLDVWGPNFEGTSTEHTSDWCCRSLSYSVWKLVSLSCNSLASLSQAQVFFLGLRWPASNGPECSRSTCQPGQRPSHQVFPGHQVKTSILCWIFFNWYVLAHWLPQTTVGYCPASRKSYLASSQRHR